MKVLTYFTRGPWLAVLLALLLGNCSKKKEAVEPTAPAAGPVCPVAKVTVVPDRVSNPELRIGSAAEVKLAAQTNDRDGRPVDAEVVWRFKDDQSEGPGTEAGHGHTLTPTGPRSAVFRAGGLAGGVYWIEARVPDCEGADSLPVLGLAKVTVAPQPDSPAQCGRVRVRYGSRDLANETILGFVTLNFWAEIHTRPELRHELQVRFLLNDRPIQPLRQLYRPLDDQPALDMPAHFRARMPVFLERGHFRASFELRQGDRVLCASEPVSFATR
jgi:hypothetical protein